LGARFRENWDIAVAGDGTVFAGDKLNARVRKIDPSGTITTIAGKGPENFFGDGGQATLAGLNRPAAITFDQFDNLYVADTRNHRVRKMTRNGVISTVAGNGTVGFSGDGGSALA